MDPTPRESFAPTLFLPFLLLSEGSISDVVRGSVFHVARHSGTRGVLNDALSIFFGDATLASAFVARWCAGYKIETAGGVFQVREDEPTPRTGATLHRTP